MNPLPSFYSPTKTIFLDDDKYYPELVGMNLPKGSNLIGLHKPDEAIAIVKETTAKRLCSVSRAHPIDWVDQDVFEDQTSVFIVDYQLEDRTGIDVLSELTSSPVKKILVSNFISPQIVNDAYQQGLINAFVNKMDSDFPNKLNNIIKSLKFRFFYDLKKADAGSKLQDEVFCDFLRSLVEKHKVTHYCSNEQQTYFVLRSEQYQSPIILYALEEHDLEDILNSLQAESASNSALERIRNRMAFPCFKDGILKNGLYWDDYMRPLKLLLGKEKFYVHCHFEI